ncbi:hypothetical protein IKQ21_09620 [bacterium]|nr:hypothetical protein [bacterium]
MRVLPISFLSYKNTVSKVNRDNKQTKFGLEMSSPLMADTISFGHAAQNAEPLRKLMKIGAPNLYGKGGPVITPERFDELTKSKIFTRSVRSIVRAIEPLSDTLREIQLDILEMLKEYSKIKPEARLDEIFQSWAPLAHVELYRKQKPFFEELKEVAKDLPEESKFIFDELMQKSQDQIDQKPIVQEFNKRDFRYKLERISQRIRHTKNQNEKDAMKKLINMAEIIPHSPKPKKLSLYKNQRKSKNNNQSAMIILKQIKNFFERSAINKDEELQALFADVNCQIHGIPTFIPFGRKNFIEEIEELVQNIPDQRLAHKMIQIAVKLPTSDDEISAFIVKASRKSPEKIAFDWLWGAVGDIDHVVSKSSGGKDKPLNYGITNHYENYKKSNKTYAQLLREKPENYESARNYIKWLEWAHNTGELRKVGLNAGYVKNFAASLIRLSPPEKPLTFEPLHLK